MSYLERVRAWERDQVGLKQKTFSVFEPFESGVFKALEGIQVPPWPFQIMSVLPLLDEASDLLERCLSQREQAQAIEVRAVAAAAEHDLATALLEIDEEAGALGADTADGRIASASAAELRKAVDFLDEAISTAAEDGLSVLKARLHAVKAELAGTEIQRGVGQATAPLKGRHRTVRREMREQLLERRLAPGNAENYLERIGRARGLFYSDLREAYVRVLCAADGLETVFGIEHRPPRPEGELETQSTYLDRLVKWVREGYFLLDRVLQNEHECIIRLSLGKGYMSSESFQAAKKSGTFRFTIRDLGRRIPGIHGIYPIARFRGGRVSLRFPASDADAPYRTRFGTLKLPAQFSHRAVEITAMPRVYPLGAILDVREASAAPIPRTALCYDARVSGDWEVSIPVEEGETLNIEEVFLDLRIAFTPPPHQGPAKRESFVDPYEAYFVDR